MKRQALSKGNDDVILELVLKSDASESNIDDRRTLTLTERTLIRCMKSAPLRNVFGAGIPARPPAGRLPRRRRRPPAVADRRRRVGVAFRPGRRSPRRPVLNIFDRPPSQLSLVALRSFFLQHSNLFSAPVLFRHARSPTGRWFFPRCSEIDVLFFFNTSAESAQSKNPWQSLGFRAMLEHHWIPSPEDLFRESLAKCDACLEDSFFLQFFFWIRLRPEDLQESRWQSPLDDGKRVRFYF